MGFLYAASGPLVRSSYRAAEAFVRAVLGQGEEGHEGVGHGSSVQAILEGRLAEAKRAAERVSADMPPVEPHFPGMPAPEGLVPAAALVRRA
jgi:lipoic acid synthetase